MAHWSLEKCWFWNTGMWCKAQQKQCLKVSRVGATTPLVYSFSLLVKSAEMAAAVSLWGVKSRCPFLKSVIPSTSFCSFCSLPLQRFVAGSSAPSIASKWLDGLMCWWADEYCLNSLQFRKSQKQTVATTGEVCKWNNVSRTFIHVSQMLNNPQQIWTMMHQCNYWSSIWAMLL